MDLDQVIPELEPPVGGLARARLRLRQRQRRQHYLAIGLTAAAVLVLLIGGLLPIRPTSRADLAKAVLPLGLESRIDHGQQPIALASSSHAVFMVVMTPPSGGPSAANGVGTDRPLGERF